MRSRSTVTRSRPKSRLARPVTSRWPPRALSANCASEVANLTVLATEKVTRKVLDSSDQKRLVEEALGDLDFSGISSGASEN